MYSHLSPTLRGEEIRKKAQKAIKNLRKHEDKFDNIVFMGISGALLAPIMAAGLNKNLWAIRKEKSAHSKLKIERAFNDETSDRFIIVDDFIGNGTTINNIMKEITDKIPSAELYGIYLYAVMIFPEHNNDFFKSLKLRVVDDFFIYRDIK